MADPVRLLLLRGEDHVLLGVHWTGMSVVDSALESTSDDAWLTVTFPPQHVAEETSPAGSPPPMYLPDGLPGGTVPHHVPAWRAVLSGPSRVSVGVPRGHRVPLTAAGVLAALGAYPVLRRGTAVELPWRLATAPVADSGVCCAHPGEPVTANGVTGLWRTRLMAEGHPVEDAGIGLVAVDPALAGAPDPGFTLPVGRDARTLIAANAADRPAPATRLELSALGGTLAVAGAWENVEWEQRTALGRDMRVRTVVRGALYPLGHRAEYAVLVERVLDPDAGGAALLRGVWTLTVTEPVRRAPPDERLRREFPFDEVRVIRRLYADLSPADWRYHVDLPAYFRPTDVNGRPVLFPVECDGVRTVVPLIFVANLLPGFDSLHDPGLAEVLAAEYGQQVAPLPGSPVDLVRAPDRRDGDLHEVHSITLGGTLHADGYRPRLATAEIALPSLRALLGDNARRAVVFTEEYLRDGPGRDVVLKLAGPAIDLSFRARADRSGALVSPSYSADALSRTLGPVNTAGLPAPATGLVNPFALFPADATLLGFPLRELVGRLRTPPAVTSVVRPGSPPEVRMRWTDVPLKSAGPFVATPRSRLDLTVDITPTGAVTLCVVRDFAFELPPGPGAVLGLSFDSLSYRQAGGRPPAVDVSGLRAKFLGVLALLEELQDAVDLGGADQVLVVSPSGIAVRYCFPVPPVSAGAFVLDGVVVRVGVDIPFDGAPVSVALAFADRQKPFSLSVLMFGGGGYLDLLLDRDGLKRLEAALEFGALVAVDFVVASGEVHALGGVRFTLEPGGSVSLTGFLRIGGCVEVLGLVSVSVELRIELTYIGARKAMVGRATLVVEVDLTLWSDSVELDSGEWVLVGGSGPEERVALSAAYDEGPELARWHAYRAAFAPGGGP